MKKSITIFDLVPTCLLFAIILFIPSAVWGFSNGETISVTSANGIFVRTTPGGTKVSNVGQLNGATGIIVSNSQNAQVGGIGTIYTWWNVNFMTGDDGWVAQDFIVVVPPVVTVPTVTTNSATNVTSTSATLNGTINSNGGGTITEARIEWTPTATGFPGTVIFNVPVVGSTFSNNVSGLQSNTSYTYHVYAKNFAGFNSSTNNVAFTTSRPEPTVPTVTTNAATNVTSTSATLNGTINSNGGGAITEARIEWTPTATGFPGTVIFNVPMVDSTFSSNVAGLQSNTSYTYNVYAKNSAGFNSSTNNVTFITSPAPTPVLSVSPSNAPVSASAGNTNFSVSNTGGGILSYSTGDPSASWLRVSSGGTGGNSGTITVSYDANTGAQRSGTIQVTANGASGSPVTITVTQSGSSEGSILYGVDVSQYTTVTSWASVQAAGKSFAFIKASSGVNGNYGSIIQSHVQSINNTAPSLLIGAYHFAYPNYKAANTGAAEAQNFLNHAGNYVGPGFLPPVLDIEDDTVALNWYPSSLGAGGLVNWIKAWIGEIQRQKGNSIKPIIYTTGWYAQFLKGAQNGNDLAAYPLWIATYPTFPNSNADTVIKSYGISTGILPWTNWTFQQYRSDPATQKTNPNSTTEPYIAGACSGISGYADLNSFNGDISALNVLANNGNPPPSDTVTPTISVFNVTPSSVTPGQGFTVSYTVADSGGSHLKQVELWRASIDGTINDFSWTQIGSSIALLGDGPASGLFPVDTPSIAGSYWYGIHVTDNAIPNNYMDERIAGRGPKQVTVLPQDTQGPSLTIASPLPNAVVTSASLPVSGTASDSGFGNNGISSVTVNGFNTTGGTASGANIANWNATITLIPGVNTVDVVAKDNSPKQNPWTQSLTVTYNPPDTTLPTATITAPTTNPTYDNGGSRTVNLSGSAGDNVGVTQVRWGNDRGGAGIAVGTTNWSVNGITLQSGDNLITVTSYDAAGNTANDTITVKYTAPDRGSATRTLPSFGYVPGVVLSVTIGANPASSVSSYAVEDAPPAGWAVSNISQGGTLDTVNRKVKWGPFFDNTVRTLTYQVTPPIGETGVKTFAGSASFDGQSVSVGGTTSLDKANLLLHPADTNSDLRVVINELTAYGSAWKTGALWGTPPNQIQIDVNFLTRAGYLWKNGEVYHYDSRQTPPLSWQIGTAAAAQSFLTQVALAPASTPSATRGLPASYTASSSVNVSITATPAAGTSAYAVEDAPPTGWTVSNIDNGGVWDAVNSKVKWGPFFDNTARTLNYQATPPAGTAGVQTFNGIASFDGVGAMVGGTGKISNFSLPRYTLSLSATTGGSIGSNPQPGIDGKYADGTVVTVTAIPNNGVFQFIGWSVDASGMQNPLTVTMSGNKSIAASFVVVDTPHTVTPSAEANGSITPNTAQTVWSGGNVTFTASPTTGYGVDEWLVNGSVSQTGGSSFTLSNIVADTTVQVTFKVTPSQINLAPYQPPGWSDKIVVSIDAVQAFNGATDSASLLSSDALYVGWAERNDGSVGIPASFQTGILVDGVSQNTWQTGQPFSGGAWNYVINSGIGFLSPGTHTITLRVDSGAGIEESDETDNEFTKTITVDPGPAHQPDLLIGTNSARMIGNRNYDFDAIGQTLASNLTRGAAKTYFVQIQNDGPETNTFRIHSWGRRPGFKVRFFDGPTEITRQITEGQYRLTDMAPNETRYIKVLVRALPSAAVNALFSYWFDIFYVDDESINDSVKLNVRAR